MINARLFFKLFAQHASDSDTDSTSEACDEFEERIDASHDDDIEINESVSRRLSTGGWSDEATETLAMKRRNI